MNSLCNENLKKSQLLVLFYTKYVEREQRRKYQARHDFRTLSLLLTKILGVHNTFRAWHYFCPFGYQVPLFVLKRLGCKASCCSSCMLCIAVEVNLYNTLEPALFWNASRILLQQIQGL